MVIPPYIYINYMVIPPYGNQTNIKKGNLKCLIFSKAKRFHLSLSFLNTFSFMHFFFFIKTYITSFFFGFFWAHFKSCCPANQHSPLCCSSASNRFSAACLHELLSCPVQRHANLEGHRPASMHLE